MTATAKEKPFVCDDRNCGPICDFCQWYRFNGNEHGAYTGDGQCAHPSHPGPREPHDGCDDYVCADWKEADLALVKAHRESQRRPVA